MNCRFHSLADQELVEAAEYYEGEVPGLGIEFLEEIYATVRRIAEFPNAWPRLSERTQRCLVGRFPYGVIYQVRHDGILIVAVAHLHRKPGYWQDRAPVV